MAANKLDKRFLIFISGAILLSLFMSFFYNNPTIGATKPSKAESWSDEVTQIAFKASEYWRTPAALGGGSESFAKIEDLNDFGIDVRHLMVGYEISKVTEKEFTLSSLDIIAGSVVQSRVTYQGIASLPTVEALLP